MRLFLDKFKNAFNGLFILLKDKSVILQYVIAFFILFFYYLLGANLIQLSIILIMCIIVVCCEMINTCIEKILDYINPNYDKKIGKIKDMSAGVVLFVSILAVGIGILIFIQIIFRR